jgi:hypothetical protein
VKVLEWKDSTFGANQFMTIALGTKGRFAIRRYLAGHWLYWESDPDSKTELLIKEVSLEEAKACAQRCHEDPTFPGSILEPAPVGDVSVMPAPPVTAEPATEPKSEPAAEPESEPAPKPIAVEPSLSAAASAVASFQALVANFRRTSTQGFVDANRKADHPATSEELRHWAARMVDAANIMDVERTGTAESLRTVLGEAYRVTARAVAAADKPDNWPPLSNASKSRIKKAISALKAHDFLTLRNEYDEAQEAAEKKAAKSAAKESKK